MVKKFILIYLRIIIFLEFISIFLKFGFAGTTGDHSFTKVDFEVVCFSPATSELTIGALWPGGATPIAYNSDCGETSDHSVSTVDHVLVMSFISFSVVLFRSRSPQIVFSTQFPLFATIVTLFHLCFSPFSPISVKSFKWPHK